jgi:glycine/D-amino acid oxidase-like deaminating enzyme
VPFIGDVPGKAGQYVAAGYNGHGMARIFLCAPTLAKYMLDGTWDTAMPEAFRVTPERIAGLRKTVDHLNLGSGPAGFSKLVA